MLRSQRWYSIVRYENSLVTSEKVQARSIPVESTEITTRSDTMSKGNLISNTPAPQFGPGGYYLQYQEKGGACRIAGTGQPDHMTIHANGHVNFYGSWETNFKGMLMTEAGKQLK